MRFQLRKSAPKDMKSVKRDGEGMSEISFSRSIKISKNYMSIGLEAGIKRTCPTADEEEEFKVLQEAVDAQLEKGLKGHRKLLETLSESTK